MEGGGRSGRREVEMEWVGGGLQMIVTGDEQVVW